MTSEDHDLLIRIDANVSNLSDEILGSKDREGRLPQAEKAIEAHAEQINFWRGALALLAFLILAFGGIEAWHIFSDHSPNSATHGRP